MCSFTFFSCNDVCRPNLFPNFGLPVLINTFKVFFRLMHAFNFFIKVFLKVIVQPVVELLLLVS